MCFVANSSISLLGAHCRAGTDDEHIPAGTAGTSEDVFGGLQDMGVNLVRESKLKPSKQRAAKSAA